MAGLTDSFVFHAILDGSGGFETAVLADSVGLQAILVGSGGGERPPRVYVCAVCQRCSVVFSPH